MKYLILTLALLASVALAQEKKSHEPDLERIQELARRLGSDDPAVRQAAIEELKKLAVKTAEVRSVPILGSTSDGSMEMRFEITPDAGKEKIRGTWSDNGTKGQYTLTSKGKGRYELSARSVNPDGAESKYTDEGSLDELRKKYPFLRSFSAVFIGPGKTAGAISGTRWNPIGVPLRMKTLPELAIKSVPSLGLFVRRPSKELEYHLKLPTETTWIVESVTPGTKGAELGLKRYDLITGADDEDLTELAPLLKCEKALAIVRRSKPMRIALQPVSEDK